LREPNISALRSSRDPPCQYHQLPCRRHRFNRDGWKTMGTSRLRGPWPAATYSRWMLTVVRLAATAALRAG
jgi:hypothetical protein